jgi:Ca-activated chloride channel family protein
VIAALRRVRWILTLAAVVATVPAPVRTIVAASSGSAQTAQPPSPPGQASQPQTPFRAGVDLVSLNVTVTDGSHFVTDLEEGDIEIFEDGVKQPTTFFSKVQQPIALAVLLDTSASMESKLETAQEAAIGFARRMRPSDLMEVIDFDSQVSILQGFTSDVAALERAIRQATVNGSTSLYNAIYVSLKDLKKARTNVNTEIRREAIIVLSDGDDTSSLVAYDEVLDLAKRSETAIYAIGLKQNDGGRRDFKEAEFVLKQLSQETGGRAFYPGSVAELPKIYELIAQELSSQYAIGYVSKNTARNGGWRKLSVRVNRPGLIGRTRQGYYAPTARR